MIRVIEKSNTHVVQKVLDHKQRVLAYQAAELARLGHTEAVTRCSTLAEARRAAGIQYPKPALVKG